LDVQWSARYEGRQSDEEGNDQERKEMRIPSEEAAAITAKYELELVVIAGYDGKTLETASFGKSPMGKDMAADWADKIPAAVGFDTVERTIHEDFRATPAAVTKKLIDDVDAILRLIAFHVPTVTAFGGESARVCNVDEVFELKRLAATARILLGHTLCTQRRITLA
jgi:hypothetical protein